MIKSVLQMNLTKFLLASASALFLVNQQAGAMLTPQEDGPSAPSTVPVAQQPAAASAQPSCDFLLGLRGCFAAQPPAKSSPSQALPAPHVAKGIDKLLEVAPASLGSSDDDDVPDVPTSAAASSSPPASISSPQDPQWTEERKTWLFNAITQPSQTMSKLQSKKHPLTELQAMGIHEDDALLDSTQRRFSIATKFFEKITLAQLTALQSNEKLLHRSCPIETLLAYLETLTIKKKYSIIQTFLERRDLRLLSPALAGYMGSVYYRRSKEEYLSAEPHYSCFLKWYETYKSSSIGQLFSDQQRAEAHTVVGLAFQRIPEKTILVEAHLRTACNLWESPSTAHNLADWLFARKIPGGEFYKQRALELERQRGCAAPVSTMVAHIAFPSGESLPVGVETTEEKEVRKAAHQKIDTDPKFAAQMGLGLIKMHSSLSPQEFHDLPDAWNVFYWDVNLLTQPNIVKAEDVAATLQRINQRLPVVNLDPEIVRELANLWPLFSRTEHGRAITSIHETLRQVIMSEATQKNRRSLTLAHVSTLPGLTEEVSFIYLQQLQQLSNPQRVAIKLDEKTIILNPLHVNLHQTQPLPHNVLQILRRANISPESALYAYWKKQWDNRYGVEEARRYKAFMDELKTLHLISLGQPAHQLTAGKGGRTGVRIDPTVGDDDDDTLQTSQSASYDPRTIDEAWRRALDPTYAIPSDLAPSLDLRVTSSSAGGSESKATLFQTNPDRTETELASFRPHRTHARYYNADEVKMMTMLWNLHLLQNQQSGTVTR